MRTTNPFLLQIYKWMDFMNILMKFDKVVSKLLKRMHSRYSIHNIG